VVRSGDTANTNVAGNLTLHAGNNTTGTSGTSGGSTTISLGGGVSTGTFTINTNAGTAYVSLAGGPGTGAVGQLTLNTATTDTSSFTAVGMANTASQTFNRTAVADVAYAILTTDCIVAYTSLTAPRTATLPTSVGVKGKIYIVKDEAGLAGTQNITIATTSAQTIDGAATKVINTNFGVFRLYSNGTNWFTF
jgi:hypothetical protein